VELVTRNFWWPGVMKEVKWYVKGYDVCQQNKNRTEQLAGKLMPNSIPEKSWTHISVSQTSFGHISTISSMIPTVSKPA